eukprot:Hpha_TRINITY_DN15371_c0_g1::TRINITY_DN15371_c0_g1_i1::g.92287::m.92287
MLLLAGAIYGGAAGALGGLLGAGIGKFLNGCGSSAAAGLQPKEGPDGLWAALVRSLQRKYKADSCPRDVVGGCIFGTLCGACINTCVWVGGPANQAYLQAHPCDMAMQITCCCSCCQTCGNNEEGEFALAWLTADAIRGEMSDLGMSEDIREDDADQLEQFANGFADSPTVQAIRERVKAMRGGAGAKEPAPAPEQ